MVYKDILDTLYCKYYNVAQPSNGGEVTSSHWEKYGSLAHVKKGDRYSPHGVGFGNFIPRYSLKAMKNYLPNIRSQSLLDKFHVGNKLRSAGLDVAMRSGRELDFDCVKQILSIHLLHKYNIFEKTKTIVVIGDGYGYMTALLKKILPGSRIICINLGKILFFDVFYAEKNFPNEDCSLNTIHDKNRLIFWEAENYQAMDRLPVDLFINIASMQEMDISVVRNYFKIMRSGSGEGYFYCCNRVEKALPDGSVIRFDEYPWDRNDDIILDELCPWYQSFPILQPPFWRSFDGPIRHRLLRLSKQREGITEKERA